MTAGSLRHEFSRLTLTIKQVRSYRRLPPVLPLIVVAGFVFLGLFATVIAPHSPIEGGLASRLLPPVGFEGSDPAYLLGTDRLGRDILSRLIFGAQVTISVSLICIALTSVSGTVIGLLAGFLGGWVETAIMRLVDISLSLPGLLMAVLLAAIFGASFTNVVVIVVLSLWPSYARLVRGETLVLKHRDFVALARVAGCSNLTIMLRHILPNVVPSVLVLATLHIGQVIMMESSLSFLGLGIPPPASSWGLMISDGRGVLERAWWVTVVPGLAIVLTVISLNILGDWVRDRLDPKLRQV